MRGRRDDSASVDIGQLGCGERDAEGKFGGVNGARCPGMVGQFFGDGFGQFGTEMPEKRVPSWTEQAHEAVANQNEAGEFEKSFGDEVVHKVGRENAANECRMAIVECRMRSKKAEGEFRMPNCARLQRYAPHCGQELRMVTSASTTPSRRWIRRRFGRGLVRRRARGAWRI